MKPENRQIRTYTSYSPSRYSSRPVPPPKSSLHPTKTKRFSWKKLLLRGFLLIIALVIITGGFLGWKFYENASKLTGNRNPLALLSLFNSGPLKETNGRVNILLAGNSADDPSHQGANLTDSIMVISIDITDKSAVLLSIPRDLLVDIPSFGYQKINAAYEDGGMNLLTQIIQQDFGITSDYNALINYTAFKSAVNAVGGIRIDIQSPDPRGIYDAYTQLQLPNGWVTLTGQEALNLARARGDTAAGDVSYGIPNSDFTRTMYQRQMLVALKNKAVTAGFIINPFKVASLADAVGNNVKTNLSLGNMVSLYDKAKGINNSHIRSFNLDNLSSQDYLTNYLTADGQEALVPVAGIDNYSQIQAALAAIL